MSDFDEAIIQRIKQLEREVERLQRWERPIGGGGVTDHGSLSGLTDDDHSQYLNNTRHDTTDRHTLGTVVPRDSTKADDTAVVHKSGDESVGGIKTFTSFPVTPSSAPTSDYQAANKKYVDDNAGSGGGVTDHGALSGLADDDHTQYTTHPASSTDNAIARWDGTGGRTIQNSLVIINDSGDIDGKLINGMLINYQHVETYPTADVYIKLATLPKSASDTYASARMDGIIGGWLATEIAMYSFFAGNRETEQFYFTYTGSKTKFHHAKILAYKRSTGELDICHFVAAYSYTTFSANLSSVQGTIERSPASFIPSGTKVFDSYEFTL